MKPKTGLTLRTGFKMDLPQNPPYEEIARIASFAELLDYHYLWSYDYLLAFQDPTSGYLSPGICDSHTQDRLLRE